MASLLSKVSSAVAACVRRVSRGTRRFFRARRLSQGGGLERQHVAAALGGSGECLWRRAILMGERCEPLDFAGAIHYDSLGRRIAQPPRRGEARPPPKPAAMLCRSSHAVDEAITAPKKAGYVALVQN